MHRLTCPHWAYHCPQYCPHCAFALYAELDVQLKKFVQQLPFELRSEFTSLLIVVYCLKTGHWILVIPPNAEGQ